MLSYEHTFFSEGKELRKKCAHQLYSTILKLFLLFVYHFQIKIKGQQVYVYRKFKFATYVCVATSASNNPSKTTCA